MKTSKKVSLVAKLEAYTSNNASRRCRPGLMLGGEGPFWPAVIVSRDMLFAFSYLW